MKRLYTLLAFAMFAVPAIAQAQVVNDTFRVVERLSPSPLTEEALGQAPDWGGQPPVGGLTARLVMADDGFGNPRACTDLANADQIAGNIVFFERGSCEFGRKALYAQEAGAIGFILYNCEAGSAECANTDNDAVIFMGGGAFGGDVTIPGASISYNQALAGNWITLVEDPSNNVQVTMHPFCEPDGACGVAIDPNAPMTTAYEVSLSGPNPFGTATALDLRMATTQDVRVEVFNTLGQRVAILHEGPLSAGAVHTFTFAADGLSSGAYFYRITGETFAKTQPVVLAR